MKKSLMPLFLICLVIASLFGPIRASAEGTELISISTSIYHSVALDESGEIWAWGHNNYGQFGNGTKTDSATPVRSDVPATIQQVVAGGYHSIALDTEQRIWTVGRNDFGQLGNGIDADSSHWSMLNVSREGSPVKFTRVGANRVNSYALDENGRLWGWGLSFPGESIQAPIQIPVTDSGTPVEFISFSANDMMMVAIDSNYQLWEIVDHTNSRKIATIAGGLTPNFREVSIGGGQGDSGFLAIALDDNDHIWIWGTNTCNLDGDPDYICGQQGDGGANSATRLQPIMLEIMDGGSPVKFKQVSGGNYYVLALDESGSLWSWGANDKGQLGDGTMQSAQPPQKIEVMGSEGPITFTSISAGYGRSFGLTTDGGLWEWGEGYGLTPSKHQFQPRVSFSALPENSSTFLEEVTLTAVVSGDFEFPSGTVEFWNGATLLGTRTLLGGTASLNISSLPIGTLSLRAVYSGDENYVSDESEALSYSVNAPDAPVITLTASPTDDTFKEVTISAEVAIDGQDHGNALAQLKWLAGNRSIADFAGSAGADIISEESFKVSVNGTYTVYARDAAGIENVKTIEVNNIVAAGDASALLTALGLARQALIDHPIGTNVGEAPEAAHDVLQSAIDVAQGEADAASSRTQAQLDTATDDLNTALAAFRLTVIEAGDASALLTALGLARQALIDHPIGTNVGEAPEAAHDVLQSAIDVAQGEADAASSRTQAQLDTATDDLNTALAAFRLTVIGAGDSTGLLTALGIARQALIDHPIGTNVGEAPEAAHDALQTAIDVAQGEADAASSRTQAQLDTATDDLNTALAAFRLTVIGAGDSTGLLTALGIARQALIDHPVGTNVGEAPTAAHDALQTAIDVAQGEADAASSRTQAQLDTATDDLNTALAAFRLTVIEAGDASALLSALGLARQALIDHPVGTNVGEAPTAAHDALQTAIDVAQGEADAASSRTQAQLDTATDDLNTALSEFRLMVVGLVMIGPEAGLYGPGGHLSFTLVYKDDVVVSGTPQLELTLGKNSVTETVYAPYTGTRGEALTQMTFVYPIPPEKIAKGINISSRLYFPDGASIDWVSGGMALNDFVSPDLSGIRIVSFPPNIELEAAHAEGLKVEVTVTASAYGEQLVGNELVALRLLKGNRQAGDFDEGKAGDDLFQRRSFIADENEHYTVYARDAVGNEVVRNILINSITKPSPEKKTTRNFVPNPPREREYMLSLTADSSAREWLWTEQELKKKEIELDGRTELSKSPSVWTLSVPKETADLLLRNQTIEALTIRTDLGDYELPIAMFEDLSDQPYSELRFTLSIASEKDQQDLARASAELGADIREHPLQLSGTIIVAGEEQPILNYGHYLTLTTPVAEEQQQSMLVALYDEETRSFVAVPSALDKAIDGGKMNWRIRSGGLYTILSYDKKFSDMQGSWAESAVTKLASKLIVYGLDHTNFGPQTPVTRAEFTAMVIRALGLQSNGAVSAHTFSDVSSGSWYASTIEAAAQAGIASGDGRLFRPNESLSRQEAVILLLNARKFVVGDDAISDTEFELNRSFTDAEQISSWAREHVAISVREGLIHGYPDGSLRPQATITRAEAAVMLVPMLQSIGFLEN